MSLITIDQAKAGMVLSKDAQDRNGRVLLREGTILTEKHLHILKSWGVQQLEFAGPVDEASKQVDYPPAWLAEAEQKSQQRFQHNNPHHPVIELLQQYWKQSYLAGKERLK